MKWPCLRVCIHVSIVCYSRPGLIGVHSQTGHLNAQDWFYWLVAGVARLGCYPAGPGCNGRGVLTVPVDVTAKAIVFLTIQSLGTGQ